MVAIKLLSWALASAASVSAVPSFPKPWSRTTTIDTNPANTTSSVEFTYPGWAFDGLKVHPPNATTLDVWYFDALSEDLAKGDLSSVVLTFLISSAKAFPTGGNRPGTLLAFIAGSFKNGQLFGPLAVLPQKATIDAEWIGSSGQWGEQAGWNGSFDGREWEVYFNNPQESISGSLSMKTTASPHLPCSGAYPGATEVLVPHVGWSNAVPDAKASVNFNVNGTTLAFKGVGYHDKNWSDEPFFENLSTWYWGHGRLGPYSIVWFDARDHAGKEYSSSYVSRDGEILSASCTHGKNVVVRPWGGDDTYPPPPTASTPDGLILNFEDVAGKKMVVNATNTLKMMTAPGVLDRWVGTLEGEFEGKKLTGVASYEQFKI